MSNIRTTIEQAVPDVANSSAYSTYVNEAVAALESREQDIKEALLSVATGKGLSEDEVQAIFVQVGLSEPEPEPEAEAPFRDDDLGAQVATLAQQVAALTDTVSQALSAARRQGVQV